MTCAACQATVQRALTKTPGVTKAAVNLMTNEATVHYDPATTDPSRLVAAINDTGYVAHAPAADTSTSDELRDQAEIREYVDLRRKAIVSLVLGAAAMLAMPVMEDGHRLHADRPSPILLAQLAATIFVMVWAGRRIYVQAFKGLLHGASSMNTLIAIGTGAAFLFSIAATFTRGAIASSTIPFGVYYEAVILIIGLVLLGQTLEARAKRNTTSALRALAKLQPSTARVRRDGREIDVPIRRRPHRRSRDRPARRTHSR